MRPKGAREGAQPDLFNVFRSTCNRRACPNATTPCFACAALTASDSDVLVWAAPGIRQIGLQRGAEDYFNAVVGEDSAELENFNNRAAEHGITPDSLPPL